jgi:hypothetical protein
MDATRGLHISITDRAPRTRHAYGPVLRQAVLSPDMLHLPRPIPCA